MVWNVPVQTGNQFHMVLEQALTINIVTVIWRIEYKEFLTIITTDINSNFTISLNLWEQIFFGVHMHYNAIGFPKSLLELIRCDIIGFVTMS